MSTQVAAFERRVNDLRAFRAIERAAIKQLEATVDDADAFAQAEAHHSMVVGAIKIVADELKQVWYE